MGLRRFADAERGSLFAFWVRRAFGGGLLPHPQKGAPPAPPKGRVPYDNNNLEAGLFWGVAFAGTLSPHPYQGAALNLPKGLIPLETLLLPRFWYGG